MLYRFLVWLKNKIFGGKFLCQACGEPSDDYKSSGVIKVKYENGAIMDMLICSKCCDRLDYHAKNSKKTTKKTRKTS